MRAEWRATFDYSVPFPCCLFNDTRAPASPVGGEAVDVGRFGSMLSPTRYSLIFLKRLFFTNQRNASIFQCTCVFAMQLGCTLSLYRISGAHKNIVQMLKIAPECAATRTFVLCFKQSYFSTTSCVLCCDAFFYSNPLSSSDLFMNSSAVSLGNQLIYPVTQITWSSGSVCGMWNILYLTEIACTYQHVSYIQWAYN